MNWTAIAPSPTAVAHRLVEPERTSPAAKTPWTLVSRMWSAPAAAPVRMKPFSSRATTSSSQSVQDRAPRKRNRNANARRSPLLSTTASSWPVRAVQLGNLTAVAVGHAVALELVDEVVGHRLAQVGAAVKQRHERAAAREPDGGLAGGVASADHDDPLGAAQLCLGWPGGVEDPNALVLGESLDRKAPVLRAGRE